LTISEDCTIVTVQHIVYQGKSRLLVDETLGAVGTEHVIEGKAFGLLLFIFFYEMNLAGFLLDLNDTDTT
jgi:type III secretory pathway component EscT